MIDKNETPIWIKEKRVPTQQERDTWDDSFGPTYYTGVCDDCISKKDKRLKSVKRFEGDGLAFCREHWKNVEKSFRNVGEFCEPFEIV